MRQIFSGKETRAGPPPSPAWATDVIARPSCGSGPRCARDRASWSRAAHRGRSGRRWRRRRQLLARRRLGQQQVGLDLVAAIGDARRHDGKLQGRAVHVALTDAEIERVAMLPGLAELLLLPGARRLVAGRFAGQAELAD